MVNQPNVPVQQPVYAPHGAQAQLQQGGFSNPWGKFQQLQPAGGPTNFGPVAGQSQVMPQQNVRTLADLAQNDLQQAGVDNGNGVFLIPPGVQPQAPPQPQVQAILVSPAANTP